MLDILGIAPAKTPDVRSAGGIGKADKKTLDRFLGFTDPTQLSECRGTHRVTPYVFGPQDQTAVRPGQSRLVLPQGIVRISQGHRHKKLGRVVGIALEFFEAVFDGLLMATGREIDGAKRPRDPRLGAVLIRG